MDFREKLAWYIKRSYPILPLHYRREDGTCSCGQNPCLKGIGKHPAVLHGWKDASRDLAKLEAWHKRFPNHNWGIVMGAMSNLCCLDIDPRHKGIDSLNEIFPNGLPETLTLKTGRLPADTEGGFHYLWEYDGLYNRTERGFLPGLDFLSDGSYNVGPGSVHETGGLYTVLHDLAPAPLPEALKSYLRKQRERKETDRVSSWDAPIKDGTRDETITSQAGKLFYIGFGRERVLELMLNQNETYCEPPLEDAQVAKIVNSIAKAETDRREKLAADKKEKEEKKALRGGFNLISFKDALVKYSSEPEIPLIEGWMPSETVGFMVAPPESGKTWMIDNIHYSLATGEPFLGEYEVNRTGMTYKINLEDHPRQFFSRIGLIAGSEPVWKTEMRDGEEVISKFKYPAIDRPLPIRLMDGFTQFNFLDKDFLHDFEMRFLRVDRPIFVSFDPFYALVPNDDHFAKAAYFLQIVREWRDRYKTSFLFVHHMGKETYSPRLRDNGLGSVLLNAFCETSIAAIPISRNPISLLVERVIKDNKYLPKLIVDFKVTDYTFEATIENAPENEMDLQAMFPKIGPGGRKSDNYPANPAKQEKEIELSRGEQLQRDIDLIVDTLREKRIMSQNQAANATGLNRNRVKLLFKQMGVYEVKEGEDRGRWVVPVFEPPYDADADTPEEEESEEEEAEN